MGSRSSKIIDGGKLVIPVHFRRELGLSVGDTVIMEVDNGELRVRSLNAAISDVQKLVHNLVPEGDPPPLKWSALKYGFWSLEEDGHGKTTEARRDRREATAG